MACSTGTTTGFARASFFSERDAVSISFTLVSFAFTAVLATGGKDLGVAADGCDFHLMFNSR